MKKNIPLFILFVCISIVTVVAISSSEKKTRFVVCENGKWGIEINLVDGYDVIYPYYDKEEGKYYCFLPSLVQDNVIYGGNEIVIIDGKQLQNRGKFVWKENESYSILIQNNEYLVSFQKSENLPSVFIDVESGSMEYLCSDKENTENGKAKILDANGLCSYEGNLTISGRGNSTWLFKKKPFNIKLEKATKLFGMSNSKKWCLMANAWDYSYMNNSLAYDMSDYVGLKYTPQVAYVDVYFNGEYWGLYLLSEAIEVNSDRIDIIDLEKENIKANGGVDLDLAETFDRGDARGVVLDSNPIDISGGYVLERDYRTSELFENGRVFPTSWFETTNGTPIGVKSPKHATEAEITYIMELTEHMEEAILSDDGFSSEGKYYTEYIDLESWVKWYLVGEISYDMDKGATNTNFYKYNSDISDKFFMGPAWDYDCRWGGTVEYTTPEALGKLGYYFGAAWFKALYSKEEFYNEICRYWPVYKKYLLEEAPTKMDNWKELIRPSVSMDIIRWNNRDYDLDEEVDFLKVWIQRRIRFLSSCWE